MTAGLGGAVLLVVALMAWPPRAQAQDSDEQLARQLSTPALPTSVPLQLNDNSGIGLVDDGRQWVLNVQPVVYQNDVLESPDRGPQGVGLRLTATLLYPR